MNYQKGNTALIVLVSGALLIVILAGFLFFGKKNTFAPVPAPVAPVKTEEKVDPNLKTFTSTDLGISFNYLEMQNEEKFAANAVGNRVYVYQTKYPQEQGQYVEVFSKNKTETLESAIKRKFLPSYSPDECLVELGKNPVAKQNDPANFVFAQITVPISPDDGMEQLDAKWQKCPATYTSTNGISYFLSDTNHPDKMVFFSIGQYAIDAGTSLPWQSTIKFL